MDYNLQNAKMKEHIENTKVTELEDPGIKE